MAVGSTDRYRLSFTVGGLFVQESIAAARLWLEHRDWSLVRSDLVANNLLQARMQESGKRMARELVQRMEELTETELEILAGANAEERAQIMWVAACRRYKLIAEFAEEVLHERFLLMAPDLTIEHFEAFLRGKTLWHPELAELKESTTRELRKTLFKMMREADLVTGGGTLVPTILSARVRNELEKREPSDVRLFATREAA